MLFLNALKAITNKQEIVPLLLNLASKFCYVLGDKLGEQHWLEKDWPVN